MRREVEIAIGLLVVLGLGVLLMSAQGDGVSSRGDALSRVITFALGVYGTFGVNLRRSATRTLMLGSLEEIQFSFSLPRFPSASFKDSIALPASIAGDVAIASALIGGEPEISLALGSEGIEVSINLGAAFTRATTVPLPPQIDRVLRIATEIVGDPVVDVKIASSPAA